MQKLFSQPTVPGTATTSTVRLATLADAERLALFAGRIFRQTYAASNTPENLAQYVSENFGVEQLRVQISAPDIRVWLLECEAGLAGYAVLRPAPAPDALRSVSCMELQRFYIDQPYHGAGFAARLMAAVKTGAAQLGNEAVWLSVWENNLRAIAFYRKAGYESSGNRIFMFGREAQTDLILSTRVA